MYETTKNLDKESHKPSLLLEPNLIIEENLQSEHNSSKTNLEGDLNSLKDLRNKYYNNPSIGYIKFFKR